MTHNKDDSLDRAFKEIERMFENGRNRRASQTGQGSAPKESYSGPGRSGQKGTNQRTINPIDANQGAGKRASITTNYLYKYFLDIVPEVDMAGRRRRNKWAPPWMSGELGKPNAAVYWCPHFEAAQMESEDIIAGEIIAWRAWYWNGKRLRSIFVDYEWPIDGPAIGQPNRGYGIHAFKTLPRVLAEYHNCIDDVLIGEVALWGDVIEFQGGYTAEFARVISLKKAPKVVNKLYGIEKQL